MAPKKYDTLELENLLFRRQFILGPSFMEGFPYWKRIKVRNNICLTVHPDLNAYKALHQNKSIILLGYILDPDNPEEKDCDIIGTLFREFDICDRLDNFFEHTFRFGGRWVLIVDNGREIRLFNDATGLRQAFYTEVSLSQGIWCASQPGLIAKALNLDMDKHVLSEFMASYEKDDGQYWWPGDVSPYEKVKLLLPNHFLDLDTGLPDRYWPDRNLDELSLEEAAKRSSEILKGLMQSAHNRFDLAVTLTAGWDSRILLAATKEIANTVFYFTLIYWNLTENSSDVKIPSRLLSKLGLKHNLIRCPEKIEDDFKKIYKGNVTTAREVYGNIAQGLYDNYPQDKLCVKGNASEVARCFYRNSESDRKEVTSEQLANLTHMGANSFAVKAFDRWLREASNECCNMNILDLFYWEQRMGSWQAMSQLEWDIVQEVFTPFNCRSLLINMLSVNEKYRKPPEYSLHKEITVNLWPEVLCEPINPQIKAKMTKLKSIKNVIKNILIKTHFLQFVPKEIKNIARNINPF